MNYGVFEILSPIGENVEKKGRGYDMDGIRAQKIYEQNPEAVFVTKESMALLGQIIKDYPVECKYAYYLRMTLVEGYSERQIARIEGTRHDEVQRRIEYVTNFLRKIVRRAENPTPIEEPTDES